MTERSRDAAEMLRAARAGTPIAVLPEALRPTDQAGAYAIQHAGMAGVAIGGWKVGAPGPVAPCLCAPMPASGIQASPARIAGGRLRGVEAEVAFRLGADLPPRGTPYSRAEVIAALATAHPVIEVLEAAYADLKAVGPLDLLADRIAHGGFVYGEGVAAWQGLEFAAMTVTQRIGDPEIVRTGNPAGDMIRLVEWLANEGSVWAGGLRAGQIVTCGSWTGMSWAAAGARVSVDFSGLGAAQAVFAA